MVKQAKIALYTFDGERCYNKEDESVSWGYSEYENWNFVYQSNKNEFSKWLSRDPKIFSIETTDNPLKKNYVENHIDVIYNEYNWDIYLSDLNDYGLKKWQRLWI